ncbi:hypothetical protein K445DRAFT_164562 [Daldinia sp. EC12]|nr:hypothetical protein K445DRAFT_164562 [Daldinia sp. EC12]
MFHRRNFLVLASNSICMYQVVTSRRITTFHHRNQAVTTKGNLAVTYITSSDHHVEQRRMRIKLAGSVTHDSSSRTASLHN